VTNVPLFSTDDIKSEELAVAFHFRTLISTQELWQELVETDNTDAAAAKFKIAIPDAPDDGMQFSIDELAQAGCLAVMSRVDGSHVVTPGGFDRPDERGVLQVIARRYIREAEDPQDAFLYFWDRTSALVKALHLAIETLSHPQIRSIQETVGPYRNDWKTEVAQGQYCWTAWAVTWGDLVDE
jgi:hypothetical protein